MYEYNCEVTRIVDGDTVLILWMLLSEIHHKSTDSGCEYRKTRNGNGWLGLEVKENHENGDCNTTAPNTCHITQSLNHGKHCKPSNLHTKNWEDCLVGTNSFHFHTALIPWMVRAVFIFRAVLDVFC